MFWPDFISHVLATWYLSYILTAQNGPFLILARLREVSMFKGLLSCIYCVAPYVALGVYLAAKNGSLGAPGVRILAIAGGALMARSFTGAGMHDR